MIPLGVLASARVSSGATVLASDNFNRADSTTTLGTSSGGQAWTARSGTWGIKSNGGYVVAGSDVVATVDVGRSQDFTANISMNSAPGWPGLVVRYADASNHYWVELVPGGSGVNLSRRMAGAKKVLVIGPNTRVAWQSVSVVVTDNGSGTRFVVTVDGAPRIDYTDSTAGRPAGNHVGMYAQLSDVPAFDNFTVTAP